MADDTALLKLEVEVREAIAKFDQFLAAYTADMQKLGALTKAGAGPASAEFVALRQQALASGAGAVRAAQQGVEAMTALAVATNKPTTEATELAAEIGVVRNQLRQLRGDAAGGAGGLDLLGGNLDKLSKKFSTFATGIVAGLALGPVIRLLGELTDGVEKGLALFQQYATEALAGGEATAKLGEQSKRLTTAQLELAGVYRQLALQEAAAIKARNGSRLSVEELADATEHYRTVQASIEDEYRKEIAAANSVAEVSAVVEKRKRALAEATREYRDAVTGQLAALQQEVEAGKALAEQMNQELSARQALRGQILGDVEALDKETANLLSVIANAREHGGVTKEQAAKIVEAVKAKLAAYEEYGLKVPSALQAITAELGILTAAQEKARQEGEAFTKNAVSQIEQQVKAQQAADAPKVKRVGDARERVETLKEEVAALEEQNDQALISIESSEELAAKKIELKRAEQDLNRATIDNANALQSQGDAAEIAKNRYAELVNQYALAHGEIDELGRSIQGSNQELLAAADGGLAGVSEEAAQVAAEGDSAAAAIQRLADRQHEGIDATGEYADETERAWQALQKSGEAADKAGPKLKEVSREAAEGAREVETVYTNIADTLLPKWLSTLQQIKAEQAGAN